MPQQSARFLAWRAALLEKCRLVLPPANDFPIPNQYGDVSAIYDALMANVPHGAWLSRIEREARLRDKFPRSALDVACGTGIVSELLHERGYRPVQGVDISPAMISIARTKAQALGSPNSLRYDVFDAAALDLGDARFDMAVSLFDSLNYILEPAKLQAAFKRVFQHITPGGFFAFDMNALYALSHDLFTQSQQFGPVQHVWKAHWDRESRICRVEMDFWVRDDATGQERHFHETHVQRAYTVPEIRQWLMDVGFVDIVVYSNYTDRQPGPRSDRLFFFAEKPNGNG
jgi:ubiquinone/menaquinone biosynthesis C-methylase UbiE